MNDTPSANDSSKLDLIAARLEVLSARLERAEIASKLPTKDRQPWWTVAAQVLGVPAAVMLILFQWSQTQKAPHEIAKTTVETAKLQTEELKARAELQQILEKLADQKGKGIQEYQKQLAETLPRLEATITKVTEFEHLEGQRSAASQPFITKYLLLWIFLMVIHLAFNVFTTLWHSVVSLASAAVYTARSRKSAFWDRLRRFINFATPVLYPLPEIGRWAVELAVIVVVLVPFFDQLSGSLGSSLTFDAILQSLKQLNVGEAVHKVRTLVIG